MSRYVEQGAETPEHHAHPHPKPPTPAKPSAMEVLVNLCIASPRDRTAKSRHHIAPRAPRIHKS